MSEKKEAAVQPLEDFSVVKKGPHISEYDTEQNKKTTDEAE